MPVVINGVLGDNSSYDDERVLNTFKLLTSFFDMQIAKWKNFAKSQLR